MKREYRILIYIIIVILLMIGLTYGSVPLYRIFCQLTGYGGTVQILDQVPDIPISNREISIKFNGDVSNGLGWSFYPMQNEIKVIVGESALAFFKATNYTKESIIGISTYNVTPAAAAIYFNKIQCFCFDEQLLKAGESIEMPVFFFIDPDFLSDPRMENIDTITLSYTFFPSEIYQTLKLINH